MDESLWDDEPNLSNESELSEQEASEQKGGEQKASKEPQPPKNTPAPEKTGPHMVMSEAEYFTFKQMEQERDLLRLERDLQAKYPDFKMSEITDEILAMEDKEKGSGSKYFNSMGIENLYLTKFHGRKKQVAESDDFDTARGMSGGVSMSEKIAKINSGELDEVDEMEIYKKLF